MGIMKENNLLFEKFINIIREKYFDQNFMNLFNKEWLCFEVNQCTVDYSQVLSFFQNLIKSEDNISIHPVTYYEEEHTRMERITILITNDIVSTQWVFDVVCKDEKIIFLNINQLDSNENQQAFIKKNQEIKEIFLLYKRYHNQKLQFKKLFQVLKTSYYVYCPLSNYFSFFDGTKEYFDELPLLYDHFQHQIFDRTYSFDLDLVQCAFSKENISKLLEAEMELISIEFRIRTNSGTYRWVCMEMILMMNTSGMKEILGYLKDIDLIKEKEIQTILAASKDVLTNFYNKGITKEKIDSIIQENPNQEHALIFFDIDNLKRLNDRMGHALGDTVIEYFSKIVFEIFRSTDIFGRIGGDEFVIFMQNITNTTLIRKKIQMLMEKFSCFTYQNIDITSLSCSAGVALYPKDGKTYQELVEKADQAMYCSKDAGKNNYSFYSEEINVVSKSKGELESIHYTLFEKIYHLFYESKNFYNTLLHVLQLIGEKMNCDNVEIFLLKEDGNFHVEYGWYRNKGYEKNCLITDKDYKKMKKYFHVDGYLSCNNIQLKTYDERRMHEQIGYVSFFHMLLIQNHEVFGIMTIGNLFHPYFWNQQEIDTSLLISKIISSQLIYRSTRL